mmetsp:Transcript_15360/g.32321  ORF Transcript_15360/g.32321 Transcript_15360/m.32321 type:complete len:209 (+) Transcript_15360:147-773(+)
MQSVQSPSNSLVFSSMETLTPPPTPGRKRLCFNLDKAGEMPMFFSSDNSLIREPRSTQSCTEIHKGPSELFSRLATAPLTSFKLKARPIYGTRISPGDHGEHNILSSRQVAAPTVPSSELPALPFDVPSENLATSQVRRTQDQLPSPMRKVPTRSVSDPTAIDFNPKISSTKRMSGPCTRKLPAFQRGSLTRSSYKEGRRNSFVARSA